MFRKCIVLLVAVILSGCNPFAVTQRQTSPEGIVASGPTPIEVIEGCPATLPPEPAFVPRSGLAPDQGHFFYGTDSLWTTLPSSGVWDALPQTEKGFTQKIFLWSEEFDINAEPQPSLTVTASLLDDKNPTPLTVISSPATTGQHGDSSFMLVGMDFPSTGCWQITGEYKSENLSFVVLVKP